MNDSTIIGAVITAVVTIIIAAFALVKQSIKQNGAKVEPTEACLVRILSFMDSTERVLVEASRIQHTHSRYMNDLRQELSLLRTEISEMKGMLR